MCAKSLQCAFLGKENNMVARKWPSTNGDYEHLEIYTKKRKCLQVRAREQILIPPNQDKAKPLMKNIYAKSLHAAARGAVAGSDRPAGLTEGTVPPGQGVAPDRG